MKRDLKFFVASMIMVYGLFWIVKGLIYLFKLASETGNPHMLGVLVAFVGASVMFLIYKGK